MAKIRLRYVHEYVAPGNGKTYRYFRRPGCPIIRLPGIPGSREFNAAYEDAIGSKPAPAISKGGPGSIAELVTNYFRSPGFVNLAASSQATYRKVLKPILERDGEGPANELPPDKAEKMIFEIGEKRPGMANLTKKVLRTIFKFGKIKPNPFDDIDLYDLGTHHTWTDDELEAYEKRWPLGTRERLAYAVLLYTGQRVGDASRINRAEIKNNAIKIAQEKTADDEDDLQWIEMHPALVRAIQAGPSKGLTLIGDKDGRPIKGRAVSDIIRLAADEAGLPRKCVAHGLRKAACRRLAEAGCTAHEIAAISGHKSLTEIQRYCDRANRGKMSKSAVGKLPDEGK